MRKIWTKHKLGILILSYALIFGGAVYFLAVPYVARIKISADEIQRKLLDQEIDESRISQLPQMEEDWSYIQSKKELTDVILNKESEVSFIEDIDLIANKTGNVIDLKIGENVDPREISKLKKTDNKDSNSKDEILGELGYLNFFPIQINIKGDYAGFLNFIRLLENSRFYINVVSIDSKKQEDEAIEQKEDLFEAPQGEESKEKIKKEILSSVISAIVYTKK